MRRSKVSIAITIIINIMCVKFWWYIFHPRQSPAHSLLTQNFTMMHWNSSNDIIITIQKNSTLHEPPLLHPPRATPIPRQHQQEILLCVILTFKPTTEELKLLAYNNTARMYKTNTKIKAFLANDTKSNGVQLWKSAGHCYLFILRMLAPEASN